MKSSPASSPAAKRRSAAPCLAEKLEMALPAADAYVKEWNINGENAVLATRKA